jgi:hypothetical protein
MDFQSFFEKKNDPSLLARQVRDEHHDKRLNLPVLRRLILQSISSGEDVSKRLSEPVLAIPIHVLLQEWA